MSMQAYKAYIKDCLDLNGLPEAYLTIKDGNPAGDILTNASSSFTCLGKIPDEVKLGDVFCLYDSNGQVLHQGIISSMEYNKDTDLSDIDVDSIYSLFDADWFYRTFQENHLEQEVADIFVDFIENKIGEIVTTLPTANEENWMHNKLYYKLVNDKYIDYRINKEVTTEKKSGSDEYEEIVSYQMVELGESASQTPEDFQADPLFQQKYGAFTVQYENSQEVHLPVLEDPGNTRNMQQFIYDLYNDYGIVVKINIPFESGCSILIKTADYGSLKIARNSASILSISPSMEIEELNKLVVFSSSGSLRNIFYATENGIVEDPTSTGRLKVINTEFVYSDDAIDDIKTQHLKDEMYNHQIVFEMVLENQLYDFFSWNLGMPLEVHYDGIYYKTIFTGYEYSFKENERPSKVKVTCGKVRTRLTDLVNMKKV